MNQTNKDLAHKELQKIYERHFSWIERAQVLRGKFSKSLGQNPELKTLLKLAILANVGIWGTFILITYNFFIA
jgi:hypothetical protein